MKKKLKSIEDLISDKDRQAADLLTIIDILHELNGMENASDDLLKLLRKLELDIFGFNQGLDQIE